MKRLFPIIVLVLLAGCKTQQVATTATDSVRVEYRYDSIYVLQHDSIFRDRWRDGDTVFVTVEKWLTRYKDKVVIQHDTITTTQEQVVVQTERYIPKFYKGCTIGFWLIVIAVVLCVAWKIYKKIAL